MDGRDFSYKDPTELAAKLGIIKAGTWQDNTAEFRRGDMVIMAYNTLRIKENLWDNSAAPGLLPYKVSTTDFDADDHLDYYNQDTGKYYADLEYSKGMIVNSDSISCSSFGVEAIVEYIKDMESVFDETLDVRWTSGSYVKLAGQSAHLSVDSNGTYSAYMKHLNKNAAGTNLWLNFIAYVTNADVARAVYGICVEKIALGDFEHMSAELVAKYGGTLVSDVEISQTTRMASILVGGHSLNIKYTSCLDESSITNGAVLSDLIAQYTVII